MKVKFYYATLDRLITKLTRFPKELCNFAYLQPDYVVCADGETRVRHLAERNEVDTDREVAQWRLSLPGLAKCARGASLSKAYPKICSDFHDLRMLYRIALSLPVKTASVERDFSKLALDLLETKLRSTMTEERLEALMLAVVERYLLLQLSTDDLVAQFAAAANRRMNLG